MSVSLTMDSLSFYEPMRKNWFIVQFQFTGTESAEPLTIACKTCDTPHLSTQENEIDRLNDKIYTPGKSSYDAINMSFYEYMSDTTKKSAGKILYDWQQKVHNAQSGVQGSKSDISANIAIVMIDGNGAAVRTWNLYHCWPTGVEFANLDSGSGDVQDVSLSVRFDWAEMTEVNRTAS